jgi:hypothetical protein
VIGRVAIEIKGGAIWGILFVQDVGELLMMIPYLVLDVGRQKDKFSKRRNVFFLMSVKVQRVKVTTQKAHSWDILEGNVF